MNSDIAWFCLTCGAGVEKNEKHPEHSFYLESMVANRGYMLGARGSIRRFKAEEKARTV